MPSMIFVNLPVSDLAAATRFYEAIGCRKNDAFSSHQAASMVWFETITFQLLTREYFATFAPKPVADARERMDMGWMYNRAFEDPDGHVYEAVWMDPKAVAGAGEKTT